MKKLASLLLAMLMLCTMFSAFALPAAAESYANFWWEIREDLTIGKPEKPYGVDTEEYICHLRLVNNASVTVLPSATVKVSSLNLEDAGTLKIEGKVYSDHLLFFGLGDIELEEDGILDLNRVETDIPDEYLQGLRKKGYCVRYENRHLIVTTKHEFPDAETGLCSICGADCHHDYDEELVCRLCGHYPGGVDVFDISFDEDATVSGFHRYGITIASGATVTVEPSGNILLTYLKGEGTLIVRGYIYGLVYRIDPGITVVFEENGILDLEYNSYGGAQYPFPADEFFEKMRGNGAACMIVEKHDEYDGTIYASAGHPWKSYSDVHYCPKCEAEAAHDWNDGVCRVCGGNCEHWFDDDDVCYYCGHEKDTLDYLRERITEDLTVPAGDYTISSLQVEPGVTVTVEPGAHIRAENGIGSYGATLVIRGSVTAYFTEFSESSWFGRKEVGTVILEGDGIFDFVTTPRSCPIGEAGVGDEFIQELADSGLPCYFANPSHCHAAKIHTWENGICIGCGELQNGGSTGSILSEGSWWIVGGVAVLALGGATALVIVKKKRKE